MRELLFKLKKDGKTVGYELHHIDKLYQDETGKPTMIIEHSHNRIKWYPIAPKYYTWENYIRHNEKYPFVTKGKGGKDMFVGDKVKADYMAFVDVPDHRMPCRGIIKQMDLVWYISEADGSNRYELIRCKDIELIEETK